MSNILDIAKKIDLHIHTSYSDGENTIGEILRVIELKGLSVVAITDHYSEFRKLPKRMSVNQFLRYLDALKGTRVLKGVEAEILENGNVSISKRNADLCDLVIGGLHRFHNRVFWKDPRPIWDSKGFIEDIRMTLIKAMETGLLDVLAHSTWLPWGIRHKTDQLITMDWVESIVDVAKDQEVAIEISGAWKVPDESFIQVCIHRGVKLSVGSDAHTASSVGGVSYSLKLLKRTGVPKKLLFVPPLKH